MAGFRKARAEQAALKIGIYGASGRGKTFTALTMAEGLAKASGKRIAFVDTERGTDFYAMDVKDRIVHPEAFDFDAIYTRAITEILNECKKLDPNEHGVLIIDSITHVWEAARNAYNGKMNSNGQLPMYAWAKIKKPYKDLMAFLLSSPMHVFILGREGTEFAEDETGETKAVGKKMKAEGETAYEPHILMRMVDPPEKNADEVWTYIEKDRTGIFRGKYVRLFPAEKKQNAFDLLAKRWLALLGGEQAKIESEDESAGRDAEALAAADQQKQQDSRRLLATFTAKLALAETPDHLKVLGKEITPEIKKQMTPGDVATLRTLYQEREQVLTGRGNGPTVEPEAA